MNDEPGLRKFRKEVVTGQIHKLAGAVLESAIDSVER